MKIAITLIVKLVFKKKKNINKHITNVAYIPRSNAFMKSSLPVAIYMLLERAKKFKLYPWIHECLRIKVSEESLKNCTRSHISLNIPVSALGIDKKCATTFTPPQISKTINVKRCSEIKRSIVDFNITTGLQPPAGPLSLDDS